MIRAIRTAIVVTLLALGNSVSAQPLAAQDPPLAARLGVSADNYQPAKQDDRPSKKETGTATIISILIVGGGQIYAGETTRGLIMLGAAYGSIIAGAVLSTCDIYSSCSTTPLAIGALAALGIYIYGIVDAAPSARRMNAKHGYKVSSLSPVMRTGPNGFSQVGVSVAF
jgi:hypothetical protein